ncbi:hypothetical protein CR513_38501, partial [Mucuna pruriens]
MKQLATSNLEFQQSVSSSNMQFQQNMTTTIQDLKTQIGQLANTVSQMQSAGSSNLPSQTIPNPRGNASVVTLRSGKELPQPTLQQLPRSVEADSEQNADLPSWPAMTVPLPFPSRTTLAKKSELDEELLKMCPNFAKEMQRPWNLFCQRVDLPSRFLCARHGGGIVWGRIFSNFGMTFLDNGKDKD